MSKFVLAPSAISDIAEVWEYYADEIGDPDLADRMRDEIFAGIRKAARTPDLGHYRRDLADEPVRFWRVRKFLIIYRSEVRPIEIARVLHGNRDVETILHDG